MVSNQEEDRRSSQGALNFGVEALNSLVSNRVSHNHLPWLPNFKKRRTPTTATDLNAN
jgi:hypothetical protein